MTFLRSLTQQWEKAYLSQALQREFEKYSEINQFFNGATTLSSVTNMMAALVYSEGKPNWLPQKMDDNNLSDEQVSSCILISCQLLFVKAVQENELNQCERLVFTLANKWVNNFAPKDADIYKLINKIYYQLDSITQQNRVKNKSMK